MLTVIKGGRDFYSFYCIKDTFNMIVLIFQQINPYICVINSKSLKVWQKLM